ncbi:hypothetical protein TWF481_008130 [Arthrobotrys musiformis]|uniref:HNH nuclease domain-containing protein n=1 Tax=Arthrobotrys musiformis TaxID=47236 RepID=A0AAV9W670_9PEZI
MTWAPQWKWSESDLEKLIQILYHGGRGNRSVLEGVSSGLNSEALLPFLLLHTPKLQSLDIGDAKLDVLGPYTSFGEAERIYHYCTSGPSTKVVTTVENRSSLWNPSLPEEPEGGGYKDHHSFLYLHMRLDPGWLPGLSNITHLAHGCHRTGGFFDRWPASHLTLMLLLPRLQSGQFYGATIMDISTPLELTIDLKVSNQKSSIKHLELLNCRFRKGDYRAIAQITGSLRSFRCILEHEEVPWRDYAYEADVRDIFRLFNINTLANENILVTRATGEDKDPRDLERYIDYGPDDDFHYDSDDYCYSTRVDDIDEDGWESSRGGDEGGSIGLSQVGDEDSLEIFQSDGSQGSLE